MDSRRMGSLSDRQYTAVTEDKKELREVFRERLLNRLDRHREVSDQEILLVIDELILESRKEYYIPLHQKEELRLWLFNSVRRLDILQELVDDNSVTEIMVNGLDHIYLERDGRILQWDKQFVSREKLEDIVQQIAAKNNRVANESTAIVDARLENGSRVNVVMRPVAIDGPVITIRRFPDEPISMKELIEWKAITEEAVDFLKDLVAAGYNIFISGGTGSGKTTFLNALSNFIPMDERIITIEDNAELQIRGCRNLVRLEARKANEEGNNEVTIRDLIKASLRMRPDRIVVGEVRGEETIDMLQAMNTGHDGSLSTGHGNSTREMLMRLETMCIMSKAIPLQAVRRQIASGIDIMVHLGRLRDKSRKVLEIVEVTGYNTALDEIETSLLYEFQEEGEDGNGCVLGRLVKRNHLSSRQKLRRAGLEKNEAGPDGHIDQGS